METTGAVRIQTSWLNKVEKKILIWMARRIPVWINSDHLTIIGFVGALFSAAGYILSNYELAYLWLASLGLVINWFGDSLDGTLARTRNAQRPLYGFFLDHNIDALTVMIICMGAGFSPIIALYVALLILMAYLLLSIFTYINTHLKGEFVISYNKFGPTEFRIIVILINTLYYFFPYANSRVEVVTLSFELFDLIGLGLAMALLVIYLVNFFSDLGKYAKLDPPHSFYRKSKKDH